MPFRQRPPEPESTIGNGKLVPGDPKKKLNKNFRVVLPRDGDSRGKLTELLRSKKINFANEPQSNALLMFYLLLLVVRIALLAFFWFSFRRTRDQMMGGGFLTGFSKSPAKRYEAVAQPVTFNDVAGLEGVKADLEEIVEYLRNPEKFQRLGGACPKACCSTVRRAPARRCWPAPWRARRASRSIRSTAPSSFRCLSAWVQAACGICSRPPRRTRRRSSSSTKSTPSGGNAGRVWGEGTTNASRPSTRSSARWTAFAQNDSVIVLASTNRPDVLDPALLRPGRFDRHITVDRPTLKGRLEIFKVHVRDVPLADDVDLSRMAAATVGLTGADIRNIVNEAALWAARQDKDRVTMAEFDYARDRVLMGAKREEVLSDKEKEKTAYHEAGHTLSAWKSPGAHRVHKVTIIPRGRRWARPTRCPSEDRLSIAEHELRDHLVVLLGGRAAEQLVYQETTAGAENDLERATAMARRMVTHWGMSERLGPVSYKTRTRIRSWAARCIASGCSANTRWR